MAAGLVASLYLGWGSQLFAAPVITNMPHRADGTRITGSQPVPKEMPRDVAVKTKPATQPLCCFSTSGLRLSSASDTLMTLP